MTSKSTTTSDNQRIIEEPREDLARPVTVPDSLLAAYAEMAADPEREAEAEEWVNAFLADALQDES